MSSTPESPGGPVSDDHITTDDLLRRHGARPVASLHDLAPDDDPFESDVEYEEFLADLYASRRADLA